MKRKVIFLDIDGVLNPKWWERKPLGLLMLLWYYLTKLLTFPIGALAMRIVEKEPVRESWGRLREELKESFSGGEMID